MEKEELHDLREKEQITDRKYNSKKFIFNNLEICGKYINGKKLQQIKVEDIKWIKLSNKVKSKTALDCRNKFVQMLQIHYKNKPNNIDKMIVDFILRLRVNSETKINWKLWKNS